MVIGSETEGLFLVKKSLDLVPLKEKKLSFANNLQYYKFRNYL
jgi:hypothetical protein